LFTFNFKIIAMKFIYTFLLAILIVPVFAQDNENESTKSTSEVGVDGYFGASNFGGSGGLGIKYGKIMNNNIIIGPSVRFQRTWSNNLGQKFGYTIFGGGVWAHARFGNYLFAGAEFELLKSPLNYIYITPTRKWVPTLFVGGGFSKEFNHAVRINAGIFYDAINNVNSPFRFSYSMHKSNGVIIPVIYRIGFFFPF
jgi:hypothetical protein